MSNQPSKFEVDTPPNPGSMEALNLGCSCPIMDNHYGKGIPMCGEQVFYVDGGCKVHAAGYDYRAFS